MAKNILISGGSGLVGMQLSALLSKEGFEVRHLTRSKDAKNPYKQFEWDVSKGYLEEGALENIFSVIHLAGAGVADSRWTDSRKKVIIESRTKTADLLYDQIAAMEAADRPEKFISASAIGYYGMDTGEKLLDENSPAGNDFLAEVVVKWEAAADRFEQLNMPVSKLRIGVVLSEEGGALVQLARPVKFGFGAALGSGDQYMSWIHIDDICGMLYAMVAEDMPGTYNGVAPHPVSNKEMTKAVAKELNKPLWLPKVPGFVLKLAMGEMAGIVLGGNKVSAEKIMQSPYDIKYKRVEEALKANYN